MRVYVLGAGASVHAGYPLASRLGMSLAAWIDGLPPGHRYHCRLRQIVRAYRGLDKFEDILADLTTCLPGSRAAGLPSNVLPNLRSDLKEAIRDYFHTIRAAPAPLYDELSQRLRPGDLVITYNYDLGIERSLAAAGLWDVRTGYGFPVGDAQGRSPIDVIKLHGSTNWRALLFGGGTGNGGCADSLGQRPALPFSPDQEYLGFHDFVDPLCSHLDRVYSLPVLIMPALPKRFYFSTSFGQEWKPFWDGLWQRAQDAIDKADELIMVGYSMPRADERARELLLGTSNKAVRLTICCGEGTSCLELRFRAHGFIAIQHVANPTLEGFLFKTECLMH